MDTLSPIEKTTRFATTVKELSDAWAFIMELVDTVGPDPIITIKPVWVISYEDRDIEDKPPRHFEVMVEGMVEEG